MTNTEKKEYEMKLQRKKKTTKSITIENECASTRWAIKQSKLKRESGKLLKLMKLNSWKINKYSV